MFQRREDEDKSLVRHRFQFQHKALTKESTKRIQQQRHCTQLRNVTNLKFKAEILCVNKNRSTSLTLIKALRMLMTPFQLFLK